MSDDFSGNFRKYLDYLLGRLKTDWAAEKQYWLSCAPSPSRFFYSLFYRQDESRTMMCPENWARDVNMFNCKYVWVDVVEDAELGGAYYTRVVDATEQLLVMGGVRLAAALNNLDWSSL
jgi:hypothetical protein